MTLPMDKVAIEPNSGCWLWLGADNGCGYGKMSGPAGSGYAHRFFYEAIVGPIPVGLQLDHLCRVRCCVNPAHLEPVTNRVNSQRGRAGHHMKDGRAVRGEQHPNATLSSSVVLAIRQRHKAGESQRSLARALGIPQPTVNAICTRRIWRHI